MTTNANPTSTPQTADRAHIALVPDLATANRVDHPIRNTKFVTTTEFDNMNEAELRALLIEIFELVGGYYRT